MHGASIIVTLFPVKQGLLSSILGDLGADKNGRNCWSLVRAKVYKTEVYKRKSPWEYTLNGLVKKEPVCVLASEWAQILRHCIFLCPISDQLFTILQSDFVLVVFFFLEHPWKISRFLSFVGPILLKFSSMVGLSNEWDEARQKVDFGTHKWDLSKSTLYITSRKERWNLRWNKLISFFFFFFLMCFK